MAEPGLVANVCAKHVFNGEPDHAIFKIEPAATRPSVFTSTGKGAPAKRQLTSGSEAAALRA